VFYNQQAPNPMMKTPPAEESWRRYYLGMSTLPRGRHPAERVLRSKEAMRKNLAKLSFSKKLEILEQLRDRTLLIAANRKKKLNRAN
jgi:hypothetical protein